MNESIQIGITSRSLLQNDEKMRKLEALIASYGQSDATLPVNSQRHSSPVLGLHSLNHPNPSSQEIEYFLCKNKINYWILGGEKADAEIFRKAGDLRFLIKYGVGLDNIDQLAMKKAGANLLHRQSVNKWFVAEYAVGAMLGLSRKILSNDKSMKSGLWRKDGGSSYASLKPGNYGAES